MDVSDLKAIVEALIYASPEPVTLKMLVKILDSESKQEIEEALEAAEQNDLEPINKILEILKNPYDNRDEINDYRSPSKSNEKYQTFCGT